MTRKLDDLTDMLTEKGEAFTLRIRGGCMQPLIIDRARVTVKRQAVYLPGDVVAYQNGIGQFVCHRFLGYVLWRNGWRAMTRTDNAPQADALIQPGCLLGKVIVVEQQPLKVPFGARAQAAWKFLQAVSRRLFPAR